MFSAPQTGVVKAENSVAILKAQSTSNESAMTKPPDQSASSNQPTENMFKSVPGANPIAQGPTAQAEKLKKQRYS